MKPLTPLRSPSDRALLVVIALALLMRLVVFTVASPWADAPLLIDDQSYNAQGAALLTGDFSLGVDVPEYGSMRTPGYPAFIAAIYLMFGLQTWMVAFAQVFVDTGTTILVFLLARDTLGSRRSALLSAGLYGFCVLPIMSTQKLANETLFAFLLVAALFVFLRAVDTLNLGALAFSAATLGLATLVRPVSLYLSIALAAVIVCRAGSWKIAGQGVAVFLLAFFAILAPWQAFNLSRYDHYSLTSIGGFVLANWYVAPVKASAEGGTSSEIAAQFLKEVEHIENPFDKSDALTAIAVDYLRSNPGTYLYRHALGAVNMFAQTSKAHVLDLFRAERSDEYRHPFSETQVDRFRRVAQTSASQYHLTPVLLFKNAIEYLLALVGLVALLRRPERRVATVVLFLVILYFVNVTSVLGNLRYRMPVVPLYLIFAGYGLCTVLRWSRARYASART